MLVVRSAGAGDEDKSSSPKDTDAEGKPTKPQEEETLVRHARGTELVWVGSGRTHIPEYAGLWRSGFPPYTACLLDRRPAHVSVR
jgi:hypothetical protein